MITKILPLIVLLITISCSSIGSTVTPTTAPTPPPTTDPLKEVLDQRLRNTIVAEREQWEELNIKDYYIEVSNSGVWANFTFKVRVKNGAIELADATCGEALLDYDGSKCKQVVSKIPPEDYTIESLFTYLENSFNAFMLDEANWGLGWHETIWVIFDEKYHFPQRIRYDHPDSIDEEFTLEVLRFEIPSP